MRLESGLGFVPEGLDISSNSNSNSGRSNKKRVFSLTRKGGCGLQPVAEELPANHELGWTNSGRVHWSQFQVDSTF
ncbi:hypothetical protein HanRHA438_Chr06g0270571 [Helianthus annuus]|nr:hypothetical protein HanRHA438_Chr06g0270571 [Helianthus annuus]